MRKITTVTTALALLVLCSGVVLVPVTAEAASEITGITVSPSSATRGSPVTITVTGKGDPCASIDLDFGDGMRHETLSGPFPRSTTHIYTSTGTRTLRARGVKGCTGNVTKTLTVTATSTDRLERPGPPIVPPPAATPPVQPPKPQIETETQRRLAGMPIIEEFRAIAPTCQLADPNRPILSFRVSNNVARVQISWDATLLGTIGLGSIYEASAEPGRPWASLAEPGIRHPEELLSIERVNAYVLTVTGASGQKVSARVNFAYRIRPPILELLSPVTKTRLPTGEYEYRVRVRWAGNHNRRQTIARWQNEEGRESTHTDGFGNCGEDTACFTFPIDLNRYGPVTFVYRIEGLGNTCRGGETIERTTVLSQDAPRPSASPPPPPPPSTTALPDLVPVIDPHDGAGLTFRIENRGRAAATAFSVSIQCDGCVGTTPNPSGFDRTDRIDPGGSWASPLVSIGVRSPDRSLIRPSEWVNVSVSTPNRESDTTNNRAMRPRGR